MYYFYYIVLYCFVCVFACMCLCVPRPKKARREHQILRNWSFLDGCKLPCECWEQNPVPLQDLQVLLTMEPWESMVLILRSSRYAMVSMWQLYLDCWSQGPPQTHSPVFSCLVPAYTYHIELTGTLIHQMFFQGRPQIHNLPASWVLELQIYTTYLTQNIYPDLFYLWFHRTTHLNEL